jgi:hypothetical protein
MLTGKTYTPQAITMRSRIGTTGTWQNVGDREVNEGATLSYSPQSSGAGTWAWASTTGFTALAAAATFANMGLADSGTYTAFFLNRFNQISKAPVQITVAIDAVQWHNKLQAAITRAEEAYLEGTPGAEELQTVLTESSEVLLSGTAEDMKAQTKKLLTAVNEYFPQLLVWGTDKTTGTITTPMNFSSTTPAGWSGTTLTGYGSNCGEFSNLGSYDFYQTLTDLESGYYIVSVQAFYRSGTNDAGRAYINGTEPLNSSFYANTVSMPVTSLYEVPFTGTGNLNGYLNLLNNAFTVFISAARPFTNYLLVHVTDGTLTVGLKKSTTMSGDWLAFRNFRLYWLGSDPTGITEINPDSGTATAEAL